MPIPHLIAAADFDRFPGLLAEWRAGTPGSGLLMLLPEAERDRLPALQAACRGAGVPLVGAVFPAIVTDAGFATGGAWAFRFDAMPPRFLLDGLDAGTGAAAERIAGAARGALDEAAGAGGSGGAPTLFLVFDGMLPDIASQLLGVYEHLRDAVRYGGVNAGSETFQPMPCLFDEERTIGNGVLGLLLPPATRLIARHDYPVSRGLMKATSTEGNRIDRIDGRPAFAVYQEVIGKEYGVELTRENFYDYAVHFPFGVVTALDVLVRIPVALSEDGALFCVGEVPPNCMLRLLRAPSLEDSACVDGIAGALGPAVAHRPLVTFYCAGRRMHFGAAAVSEMERLAEMTGATGVAGALTLGEIDSEEALGMPRFHNATVVCLA
ncbi:MAG: FIST C-terminal domain-containing protein [Rhodocyclaceae bacterium]|nr:FIST C-terminal domain-containing protein [Rhodocyclaceae bacterium]